MSVKNKEAATKVNVGLEVLGLCAGTCAQIKEVAESLDSDKAIDGIRWELQSALKALDKAKENLHPCERVVVGERVEVIDDEHMDHWVAGNVTAVDDAAHRIHFTVPERKGIAEWSYDEGEWVEV